jgi:hypothetical protein
LWVRVSFIMIWKLKMSYFIGLLKTQWCLSFPPLSFSST